MAADLSGLTIEDLTSGFRLYSREAIKLLARAEAAGLDYHAVGILCLLRHAGLKIVEEHACMHPRNDGKSRIFNSWLAVGRYMIYSALLALSHAKYIGKQ